MTYEEALTLIPEESYVLFAGHEYRFAGLLPEAHILRKIHLRIYDEEMPILHTDIVKIESCTLIPPTNENIALTQ